MEPYKVVIHPFVTEKTMRQMDRQNALEFVVHRSANKNEIKTAVEALFDAPVHSVNTRITKVGKRARVRFMPEVDAEEIGMRIGVF